MESEQKRLRWGCRRGMLELDLMLLPFFDDCYNSLSADEQALFEELLTETDPQLFQWLMDTQTALPKYQALLQKIRDHAND